MKKFLGLAILLGLAACAFPRVPYEGDLYNGARQHKAELFESGARGQVILSLSDNVSKSGFFGKTYKDVMAFKNIQTGEISHLSAELGENAYDTAMLPIGKYQVTNLYLEYVFTTTQRNGNTTIVTTHVETHDHFEGANKITFTVKPGEVTYIGNIELVKGDNAVSEEGAKILNTFKITDRSGEIPEYRKRRWEKEFGKPHVARIAAVEK